MQITTCSWLRATLGVACISVASALSGSAFAQTPVINLSQHAQPTVEQSALVSRGGVNTKGFSFANAQKQNALRADEVGKMEFDKRGTVVEIMKEDFSKMKTGSEQNPDFSVITRDTTTNYDFINMLEQFTHLPKWGAYNVWQAGGEVYMGANRQSTENGPFYGHLNTCMLNLEGHEGYALIRFRMKASGNLAPGAKLQLGVEAAETFNMGPTWRILEHYDITQISDKWQTYEFLFSNCGPTTIINIPFGCTDKNFGVFIDDVEVLQVDATLKAPINMRYSNYKGSSFTLSWDDPNTTPADSYFLNMYYMTEGDPMQQIPPQKVSVITNQEVKGTTYNVTGVTSGQKYFYTLVGKKGDVYSFVTIPAEVNDLETPVLTYNSPSSRKFIASWKPVPNADVYNYTVWADRVAEKDGTFIVTKEDFNDMKDADGNTTDLTIDNPGTNVYPTFNLKDMNQKGWIGYNYFPYQGFIAVDAYHWIFNHQQAGIISPVMDFSKNDGKIKITMKLAAETNPMFDPKQNKNVDKTVEGFVVLFNVDPETGETKQVESVYCKDLSKSWKDVEVNFTKGTAHSQIGIFGVTSWGNLYIDDLLITQEYKAGDKLREPIRFERYITPTEFEVFLSEVEAKRAIYHQVAAVKDMGRVVRSTALEAVKLSDKVSATNEVDAANLGISVNGLEVTLNNVAKNEVKVYTVDGTMVFSAPAASNQVIFNAPAKGTYIVAVGNKTVKVVL